MSSYPGSEMCKKLLQFIYFYMAVYPPSTGRITPFT